MGRKFKREKGVLHKELKNKNAMNCQFRVVSPLLTIRFGSKSTLFSDKPAGLSDFKAKQLQAKNTA